MFLKSVNLIKILVSIRRCDKSVLLEQIIDEIQNVNEFDIVLNPLRASVKNEENLRLNLID